ncbi:MAG: hypothetical protein V4473_01655 [Patescibacteria group bacterium]
MKKTQSVDELKRAHTSFLNASRFSTQQLLTEMSHLHGFDEWWVPKAEFMDSNDLCSYFKKQRNNVTKGGDDVLDVYYHISKLTLNGPAQIGNEGILVGKVGKNGPEWIPYETDAFTITSWNFKNKPEDYSLVGAIKMCEDYLDILESIVDESIQKFASLK